MNIRKCRPLLISGIAAAIFSGSLAAQNLDQLKGITGGGDLGSAASSLGSLSSISSASIANAAGVIEFCTKKNYLSGEGATSVKDQLMGKIPGTGNKPAGSNPDYISGVKGIILASGGQSLDLTSMATSAVKMACEKIFEQGKSML